MWKKLFPCPEEVTGNEDGDSEKTGEEAEGVDCSQAKISGGGGISRVMEEA